MADLRLVLPKDQRISTLAWAIWATGITPMSWAWQCGPEWLAPWDIDDVDHPDSVLSHLCHEAVRRAEHDAALEKILDQAEKLFNKQGRTLLPQGEET